MSSLTWQRPQPDGGGGRALPPRASLIKAASCQESRVPKPESASSPPCRSTEVRHHPQTSTDNQSRHVGRNLKKCLLRCQPRPIGNNNKLPWWLLFPTNRHQRDGPEGHRAMSPCLPAPLQNSHNLRPLATLPGGVGNPRPPSQLPPLPALRWWRPPVQVAASSPAHPTWTPQRCLIPGAGGGVLTRYGRPRPRNAVRASQRPWWPTPRNRTTD